MSGHFYCSIGNWIAGLADYTLTACKPDSKEIEPKQTAATVAQQAQAALANAPKNACRDGFVYIPAGALVMGSEDGQSDERPVLTIFIDAFCISKAETTNAQYQKMFPGTRSDGVSRFNGANQPVINKTWYNADAYCKAIDGRLPTEAEWEKAARGPKGLAYGTKSGELSKEEANYNYFIGGTKDVCSYPANGYDLCDMAGNASEWVNDWYDAGARELMKPQNPQGPDSGTYKVIKDGSWDHGSVGVRAADRGSGFPGRRVVSVGFRCVVAPQVPKK